MISAIYLASLLLYVPIDPETYRWGGDDINFSNSLDQLPGESYMHQKAVKISSQMQDIIKLHPSFTEKPIGPVHQFLSSHFQRQLPVTFLHVYVVTNQEDAALLTALCKKHHESIPDVIVYPFAKIMYNDLEKDSRVDPGAVEALSKENPTLANVLIDYFELHKFGKINIYRKSGNFHVEIIHVVNIQC